MQAPARFTGAVRAALEAELPLLRPAVIRARFHLSETGHFRQTAARGLIETLESIARHRTQGIVLKAPDTGEVNEAVARLAGRGIPVVTLVTDLPRSPRTAYVGLDATIRGLVLEALKNEAAVPGVYSIGGGNTAILAAFADSGRPAPLLLAHDLDEDNIRLLRVGQVAAVLHHDLRLDMRRAAQVIMSAANGLPDFAVAPSPIAVVTPFNLP